MFSLSTACWNKQLEQAVVCCWIFHALTLFSPGLHMKDWLAPQALLFTAYLMMVVVVLQVVQERQHAIDAAIVRVMKMRKTLAHKLLVQEVMTQLRFQLTNSDLKKRIDNLIEREFLERSSSDSQVYNYLA
jgi:hypothetical protein